eukprot:6197054-Prymnesium_polylepis.1
MRERTEQQRLQMRVSELLLTVAGLQEAAARNATDLKYAHSQMEKVRNKNMLLSAAQEQRAGAVSKIETESMYKKETGTLALMLERWHVDDRAELCYRALYRTKGEEGERLTDHLSDLEGGFLDEVRRQHYDERDRQIADHMREVFSAAKAETLRLCTGWSWNMLR